MAVFFNYFAFVFLNSLDIVLIFCYHCKLHYSLK